MVKGEIKNQSETTYQKWVGIENFTVLKFNPNKEELGELLGTDIENEPVYTDKEDKDGNKLGTISVWVEGKKSGQKFNIRFTLIDKPRVSTKNPSNRQFINSVGITSYADSKENLPVWFNHFTARDSGLVIGDKSVREARVGEEELYSFLRSWLHKLDYYKVGTELILNFNKLINGDVRELEELIKQTEFAGTFIGVAIVRSVEKDGEVKQYQGVSTKAFMPGATYHGATIRFVTLGNFPKSMQKMWKNFSEAFIGEYGEKAFFSLDLIHEYDESEDLSASNVTKKEVAEDDASY